MYLTTFKQEFEKPLLQIQCSLDLFNKSSHYYELNTKRLCAMGLSCNLALKNSLANIVIKNQIQSGDFFIESKVFEIRQLIWEVFQRVQIEAF